MPRVSINTGLAYADSRADIYTAEFYAHAQRMRSARRTRRDTQRPLATVAVNNERLAGVSIRRKLHTPRSLFTENKTVVNRLITAAITALAL